MDEVWNQRVIKHNGRMYHLPSGLFLLVVLDLVWEITRQNLSVGSRAAWPWRFTLLDVGTAATATGVIGGFMLARGQFMRASRPSLGWGSYRRPASENISLRTQWIVYLSNGGPGICTAVKVDYRVVFNSDKKALVGRWSPIGAVVDELARSGLKYREHYYINELTPGAVFPVVTDRSQRMELAAFSDRAVSELYAFDVRLMVEDVVGEIHERIIRCLYSAHYPGVGSGGVLLE